MALFFTACKNEGDEVPIKNNVPCNGSIELCNKAYNEVVFACTHNAYNYPTEEGDFWLPNQNQSIQQQLKDGIRAFMLDVHYADENMLEDTLTETVFLYHSTSITGFVSLEKELRHLHDFLVKQPNEIITLILESYVEFKDFEAAINQVGLAAFLYHPSTQKPWLTLQEMINQNQRLVVLTDRKDLNTPSWYIDVWEVAFETHFSNKARLDFSCAINRGNEANDLFIFNHFITHPIIGTGLVDSAKVINQYDYLLNRILECESDVGKIPNFITVDFYSEGELMDVVNQLNQQ